METSRGKGTTRPAILAALMFARLVLSADPTPRIVGVMTLDGPETLAQFVFPIIGFTKNAA
jgi:hypothetical protein